MNFIVSGLYVWLTLALLSWGYIFVCMPKWAKRNNAKKYPGSRGMGEIRDIFWMTFLFFSSIIVVTTLTVLFILALIFR